MRRATNDILAGKQPVAPSEAADMVQGLQEEDGCLGIVDREVTDADFGGFGVQVGKECAVGEGAVGAELVEDFGQGGGGHGDLEEVVEEGDLVDLLAGWWNRVKYRC